MSKPTENVLTPLFAAVGAGDLAVSAVADVATKLRDRAESASTDWQARADETRERLQKLPNEFPDEIAELRQRFTPEELRKVAEAYIEVATGIYNSLAERGEEAVERLRKQPLVGENFTRAESAVADARGLTEEALGTVALRTRQVGERAAKLAGRASNRISDATVEAAGDLAEASDKVVDAGADAADKVSDLGDKAQARANDAAKRVQPAAKSTPAKPAPAKKAPASKSTAARKATPPKA